MSDTSIGNLSWKKFNQKEIDEDHRSNHSRNRTNYIWLFISIVLIVLLISLLIYISTNGSSLFCHSKKKKISKKQANLFLDTIGNWISKPTDDQVDENAYTDDE